MNSSNGIIKLAPSRGSIAPTKRPTSRTNEENEEDRIAEDRSDLLFSLRHQQERIAQLYTYGNKDLSTVENAFDRKMMRPDEMELRAARQIIYQEKKLQQQQASSSAIPSNDPTKKRPLTEVSNNELSSSNKRPTSGGNSILGKLYKNDRVSTITTNPTTTNPIYKNTNTRWQGVETMRMVGNSIVDVQKLMKNAPMTNQNKPNLTTPSATAALMQQKQQQKASEESKLMSEIDELLAKKSSHNHEADAAWFDTYSQKCDRLAKQEYIADKKAQLTHVTIQAYECITCQHFVTEFLPNLCKQQGHQVTACVTIKRFFYCRNCSRKDFTLCKESVDNYQKIHMPPQRRCGSCGAHDWMAPSAASATSNNTTTSATNGSLHDDKLILSASEWSNSRDKLRMASKVCNLK